MTQWPAGCAAVGLARMAMRMRTSTHDPNDPTAMGLRAGGLVRMVMTQVTQGCVSVSRKGIRPPGRALGLAGPGAKGLQRFLFFAKF